MRKSFQDTKVHSFFTSWYRFILSVSTLPVDHIFTCASPMHILPAYRILFEKLWRYRFVLNMFYRRELASFASRVTNQLLAFCFVFLINKGRYFAFWSTQLLKTKLYRRGYIVIMLGIFVAFFSATSLPVSVTIYFHGIFSHENQIQDPLNHRFIMSMFIFNPVVARDKQGIFFFLHEHQLSLLYQHTCNFTYSVSWPSKRFFTLVVQINAENTTIVTDQRE